MKFEKFDDPGSINFVLPKEKICYIYAELAKHLLFGTMVQIILPIPRMGKIKTKY